VRLVTLVSDLPDLDSLDLDALKALLVEQHTLVIEKHAQITSRQNEIEKLKSMILKLQRMQFGVSSERLARHIDQLELELEDLETSRASKPLSPVLESLMPSPKPARRPLPADLPRETETIQPKESACSECGGLLTRLGEDVSEVLEFVPARFKVIRTVRPKLSCTRCDRIVQEPAPHRPIARGMAGPNLLAHIVVSKYSDHLPLYRQSEIYQRQGIELDRSTLADWVGGVSRTVEPLVNALRQYVLRALEKRRRAVFGHTFVTIGLRAARMHRQFGSPIPPIANRNIRKIIWQRFAEHFKPTPFLDSIGCMKRASLKWRVGRMFDVSFTTCLKRMRRRSLRKLSAGSRSCTESRKRSAAVQPMNGNRSATLGPGRCWTS
jgi:transposase